MEQSFYNCAQNVLDDGNPVVCTIFVSMVCCCCEMSYHMLIAWRFKHCSLAIQCVCAVQCIYVWSVDERAKMYTESRKLWKKTTCYLQPKTNNVRRMPSENVLILANFSKNPSVPSNFSSRFTEACWGWCWSRFTLMSTIKRMKCIWTF